MRKGIFFVNLFVVVLLLCTFFVACSKVERRFKDRGIVSFPTVITATRTVVPDTATPTPTATPTETLTPTSSPTSTPISEVSVSSSLAKLQEDLTFEIESYGVDGEYAVAVTDLQTGETISVNGDRSQLSGCVMNFFPILLSTLGVQNGVYLEEDVGGLISATIWSSNPITARSLYSIIGEESVVEGVARVKKFMLEQLYLSKTIIDHPPAYPDDSLGVDANNWVTAKDTNKALVSLYNGSFLTVEWRDYLLAKMVEVKPGLNYLIAYGNGGITSHKNGFFVDSSGWIDNDIGIVRFERGGVVYAYAISFLSQAVPWKYADISLGQTISQMVWDYFSSKYQ